MYVFKVLLPNVNKPRTFKALTESPFSVPDCKKQVGRKYSWRENWEHTQDVNTTRHKQSELRECIAVLQKNALRKHIIGKEKALWEKRRLKQGIR